LERVGGLLLGLRQERCLLYVENAEKSLQRCFKRVTCQAEFHAECMLQGKEAFLFSFFFFLIFNKQIRSFFPGLKILFI